MFSPLPFLVRPCHGQTDDLIAFAVSKLRRVDEDDDDREGDPGRWWAHDENHIEPMSVFLLKSTKQLASFLCLLCERKATKGKSCFS